MEGESGASARLKKMAEATWGRESLDAALERFLGPLIVAAGFELRFEIEDTRGQFERDYESPELVVNFTGPDTGLLLENKGELLKAFEQLSLEALRLEHSQHEKIIFDCQQYRLQRIEELGLAAQAAADKVRRTGVPYKFSPMSSRERRVIHMALRGNADVRTQSEGVGLHRQVVVYPKQAAPPPQPPMRRR